MNNINPVPFKPHILPGRFAKEPITRLPTAIVAILAADYSNTAKGRVIENAQVDALKVK